TMTGSSSSVAAIRWRRKRSRCISRGGTLSGSLVVFFPILLWALFDSRKRCLHDILAGVVVINRP
ncbi:MAG: hypothetical protein R6X03_07360, partial [Methyloceanibacter sp.]